MYKQVEKSIENYATTNRLVSGSISNSVEQRKQHEPDYESTGTQRPSIIQRQITYFGKNINSWSEMGEIIADLNIEKGLAEYGIATYQMDSIISSENRRGSEFSISETEDIDPKKVYFEVSAKTDNGSSGVIKEKWKDIATKKLIYKIVDSSVINAIQYIRSVKQLIEKRTVEVRRKEGLHAEVKLSRESRLIGAMNVMTRLAEQKGMNFNKIKNNKKDAAAIIELAREIRHAHSSIVDITRPNALKKADSNNDDTMESMRNDKRRDARFIALIASSSSGLINYKLDSKTVYEAVTGVGDDGEKTSEKTVLEKLGTSETKLTTLSKVYSPATKTGYFYMHDAEDYLLSVMTGLIKKYKHDLTNLGTTFKGDELQFYLLGPEGPCKECAMKLSVWAGYVQNNLNEYLAGVFEGIPPLVGVRIKTKSLNQVAKGKRQESRHSLSTVYGSEQSKEKGIKGKLRYYSYDVRNATDKENYLQGTKEFKL
ncbi:hypothetical protein VA7868_02346 [Vibrio aerogenes CECT 7868]|uniref:Uncharacterized protein n=1 Tax=Vibrio aerogenes CECT 7868 TaxID=1216006 RepID=A0A1M5Z652_9VIBR|nr:hypothetical protein [Vibrio aerogenes]SHI19765.1 hypothetical protein VA7868_02346 [Vibrio aerogenes CECT 7868]